MGAERTEEIVALVAVMHQLDFLARLRLESPFDPESERVYQSLCDRERKLLKATQTCQRKVVIGPWL